MTEQLPRLTFDELEDKACKIRKEIMDVCTKNGAGHIAPSLSCIDILVSLYYKIMALSADPKWENRDRLIFSKAHGAYGLYAILADIGYIAVSEWKTFYKGSFLKGCVERSIEHGLEAGCGSLGHGLPQAVGIAFGTKLQGKTINVFCIVGDGELQEGSNWEAIQFAVKHKLSNLTVIVDANGLQAMDFLDNVLTVKCRKDDIEIKMKAFGAMVLNCEGHNIPAIVDAIKSIQESCRKNGTPGVLVAKTIKGYGVKCMENIPKFHFRIPSEKEMNIETEKRYDE